MQELKLLTEWADSIINEIDASNVKKAGAGRKDPVAADRDIARQAQTKYAGKDDGQALELFIADKLEDMERSLKTAEKRDLDQNKVINSQNKIISRQEQEQSALEQRLEIINNRQQQYADDRQKLSAEIDKIEKDHNSIDGKISKTDISNLMAQVNDLKNKSGIDPSEYKRLKSEIEAVANSPSVDKQQLQNLQQQIASISKEKNVSNDELRNIEAKISSSQEASANIQAKLNKFRDAIVAQQGVSQQLVDKNKELTKHITRLESGNVGDGSAATGGSTGTSGTSGGSPGPQFNEFSESSTTRLYENDEANSYFQDRANYTNFTGMDQQGHYMSGNVRHGPIDRVQPNWWRITFTPEMLKRFRELYGNDRSMAPILRKVFDLYDELKDASPISPEDYKKKSWHFFKSMKEAASKISRRYHASNITPLLNSRDAVNNVFWYFLDELSKVQRTNSGQVAEPLIRRDFFSAEETKYQHVDLDRRMALNTRDAIINFIKDSYKHNFEVRYFNMFAPLPSFELDAAMNEAYERWKETHPGVDIRDRGVIRQILDLTAKIIRSRYSDNPYFNSVRIDESILSRNLTKQIESLAENILGPQLAKYLK